MYIYLHFLMYQIWLLRKVSKKQFHRSCSLLWVKTFQPSVLDWIFLGWGGGVIMLLTEKCTISVINKTLNKQRKCFLTKVNLRHTSWHSFTWLKVIHENVYTRNLFLWKVVCRNNCYSRRIKMLLTEKTFFKQNKKTKKEFIWHC